VGWATVEPQGVVYSWERSWYAVHPALADSVPLHCVMTRMAVPGMSGIKMGMTGMFAEARVTRVGLAAIDYRNEHGSYPATLDVLGLEEVADPFNGEPLNYRLEGDGFVIHSVGRDAADDGGWQPAGTPDNDDISWRYPAVPSAGQD